MSDKLKFWASVTLFAAIGAVTLLNQSNQNERAASKEVTIDMPSHGVDFSMYGCPIDSLPTEEQSLRCPLGNDDH